MKRREFVTSVLAAGLGAPVVGATTEHVAADQDHGGHGGDNGRQGRIVDVSFGHWGVTLPLDRFTNQNDRTQNVHVILPNPIKAHVGDTIVFHVSGLHNPQIYGPGTQPEDILVDAAHIDAGVPAIIDFTKQTAPGVFRGLDPRVLNAGTAAAGGIQDRVEAVSAPTMPGRYLVMCGVKAHFVDAAGNFIMVAFMDVEPAEN